MQTATIVYTVTYDVANTTMETTISKLRNIYIK